jgi:TraK protein
MKKKILLTGICLLILWVAGSATAAEKHIELKAEGINNVPVSNIELNRIISGEDILNIKLPESSTDIAAEGTGKNVILQCTGSKQELVYITTESDVFVLRLKPSKIPAQVIRLPSPKKPDIIPVLGNEREKLAVALIKAAYSESDIMQKARESRPSGEKRLIKGINIKEYRRYDFDEDGLAVMVYILKLADDFKYDEFKVTEKNFLIPELCKKPLGIALSRNYITKRDYTRLFIVGR